MNKGYKMNTLRFSTDIRDIGLDALIDTFAQEMKRKLHQKFQEGHRGWDTPRYKSFFKSELRKHIEKEDWIDVANFAAFLWNIQESEMSSFWNIKGRKRERTMNKKNILLPYRKKIC